MSTLKSRLTLTLALLFSSLAQTAHAFLDSPNITPEHPVAGETISVNIYGGVCDAILTGTVPPEITQDGHAIRVLFYSVHYEDAELCFLPEGTYTNPVGDYSAGSYTLQVDRWYFDGGGNPVVETLGIVPFTVAGAAAPFIPVPALHQTAVWLLILTIVGIAGSGGTKHLT